MEDFNIEPPKGATLKSSTNVESTNGSSAPKGATLKTEIPTSPVKRKEPLSPKVAPTISTVSQLPLGALGVDYKKQVQQDIINKEQQERKSFEESGERIKQGYQWSKPEAQVVVPTNLSYTDIKAQELGVTPEKRAENIAESYKTDVTSQFVKEMADVEGNIDDNVSEWDKFLTKTYDTMLMGMGTQLGRIPSYESIEREEIFNNPIAYKQVFGDMPREQAIQQEFEKRQRAYNTRYESGAFTPENDLVDIASTATGILGDPVMLLLNAFSGTGAKTLTKSVVNNSLKATTAKLMAGGIAKSEAEQIALKGYLKYIKTAQAIGTTGNTLGMYQGVANTIQQLQQKKMETGEDVSLDDVNGAEVLKEYGLGFATGSTLPLLSNLGSKYARIVDNTAMSAIKKNAIKTGIVAGELGTEGLIFAASPMLSGGEFDYKHALGVVLGLKAGGSLIRPRETFKKIKGFYVSDVAPKENTFDLDFTKEELSQLNVQDKSELFKKYKDNTDAIIELMQNKDIPRKLVEEVLYSTNGIKSMELPPVDNVKLDGSTVELYGNGQLIDRQKYNTEQEAFQKATPIIDMVADMQKLNQMSNFTIQEQQAIMRNLLKQGFDISKHNEALIKSPSERTAEDWALIDKVEKEVDAINKQRESNEKAILDNQKRLGLKAEPDIVVSDNAKNTLEKLNKGEYVLNADIESASKEYYSEVQRLEKSKQADTRTSTIEQIDKAISEISKKIEVLEMAKNKQSETGEFVSQKDIQEYTTKAEEKWGYYTNNKGEKVDLTKTEFENLKQEERVDLKDVNTTGANKVIGYHATPTGEVGAGRELGIHIGTQKASSEILQGKNQGKGSIKKIEADINNPIEMRDLEIWDSNNVMSQMLEKGLISIEKYQEIRDSNKTEKQKQQELIDILKEQGYDAISYKNKVEDVGKVSYILFDAPTKAQAKEPLLKEKIEVTDISQSYDPTNDASVDRKVSDVISMVRDAYRAGEFDIAKGYDAIVDFIKEKMPDLPNSFFSQAETRLKTSFVEPIKRNNNISFGLPIERLAEKNPALAEYIKTGKVDNKTLSSENAKEIASVLYNEYGLERALDYAVGENKQSIALALRSMELDRIDRELKTETDPKEIEKLTDARNRQLSQIVDIAQGFGRGMNFLKYLYSENADLFVEKLKSVMERLQKENKEKGFFNEQPQTKYDALENQNKKDIAKAESDAIRILQERVSELEQKIGKKDNIGKIREKRKQHLENISNTLESKFTKQAVSFGEIKNSESWGEFSKEVVELAKTIIDEGVIRSKNYIKEVGDRLRKSGIDVNDKDLEYLKDELSEYKKKYSDMKEDSIRDIAQDMLSNKEMSESLLKSVKEQANSREEYINRGVDELISMGVDADVAKSNATIFVDAYLNARKESLELNLSQRYPKTREEVLNPKKRKKNIEKMAEEIMFGALTSERFRAKFFERYGLKDVKDKELIRKIEKMAEDVYKEHGTNREVKLNELYDFVNNEINGDKMPLKAGSFIGSLFFANIFTGMTLPVALAFNHMELQRQLVNAGFGNNLKFKELWDISKNSEQNYYGEIKKNYETLKEYYRGEKPSNYGHSDIARQLAKSDNKATRGLGLYLQFASKTLSALDEIYSTRFSNIKLYSDIVKDVKKSGKSDSEAREIAKDIVKGDKALRDKYFEDATVAYEKSLGKNRNDFTKEELSKVARYTSELFNDNVLNRAETILNERGLSEQLPTKAIAENQEIAKRYGKKAVLFGTPDGIYGAMAYIVTSPARAIPSLHLIWMPIVNAPLNLAQRTIMATPIIGTALHGLNLTGRKDLGFFTGKDLEKFGVNSDIRKREALQGLYQNLATAGIQTAVLSALGAFGDDAPQKLKEELRDLSKVPITFTGAGEPTYGADKIIESAYGVRPYHIYVFGKGFSYKDTPVAPLLSVIGNYLDAIRYTEDYEGEEGKNNAQYYAIDAMQRSAYGLKDFSSMKSVSDMLEIIMQPTQEGEDGFSDKTRRVVEQKVTGVINALLAPAFTKQLYATGKELYGSEKGVTDDVFDQMSNNILYLEPFTDKEPRYTMLGKVDKNELKLRFPILGGLFEMAAMGFKQNKEDDRKYYQLFAKNGARNGYDAVYKSFVGYNKYSIPSSELPEKYQDLVKNEVKDASDQVISIIRLDEKAKSDINKIISTKLGEYIRTNYEQLNSMNPEEFKKEISSASSAIRKTAIEEVGLGSAKKKNVDKYIKF